MQRKDADQLCALTEMVWVSASQKLRAKLAAEKILAARIDQVTRARKQTQDTLSQTEHADAGDLRAISTWMKWSHREQQRLSIELARSRAGLLAERDQARWAFGRMEAAKKIRLKVRERASDATRNASKQS